MSESPDHRLRLAHPLLVARREPGVLHLGFEGRSFLLKGVPEQVQGALELLAEPRTMDELAARLPGLDRCWLDWLCEHLSTAGLLTRAGPAVRPPVLVYGAGSLAATTLSLLRAAGMRPRHLAAQADVQPEGALVVVASATAEPDRALLNRLAIAGTEHLVVRAGPTRAVVGPLVGAGGPCVRCDDLARTQLDRGWPVLLARLCGTPVEPDPALAHWAAATATVQLRCRLAGLPSELAGRSLEVGLADFRLRSRSWSLQPDCRCHTGADAASGTLAG